MPTVKIDAPRSLARAVAAAGGEMELVSAESTWRTSGSGGTATVTSGPGGTVVTADSRSGATLFSVDAGLVDAVVIAVCAARPEDGTAAQWAVVASHPDPKVRRLAAGPWAPEEVKAVAALAGLGGGDEEEGEERKPDPSPFDVAFAGLGCVAASAFALMIVGGLVRSPARAVGPAEATVGVGPAGVAVLTLTAVVPVVLGVSAWRALRPLCRVRRCRAGHWAAVALPAVLLLLMGGVVAQSVLPVGRPGEAVDALASVHGWEVTDRPFASLANRDLTAEVVDGGRVCEVTVEWRDGAWHASGPCVP